MINLVQLSKSANRISCNGVIVIMMSIASSLFAIKIHRIIISLDAQAPHIQKLSSSINLELFGGSNSSTSGFNNSTYVSPHQDQIVHEVKISSTSTEPMFVLHIGPHKTATSVIQCDLTRYRKELYETASVAYVGRIYSHCLKRRRNNIRSILGHSSTLASKMEIVRQKMLGRVWNLSWHTCRHTTNM